MSSSLRGLVSMGISKHHRTHSSPICPPPIRHGRISLTGTWKIDNLGGSTQSLKTVIQATISKGPTWTVSTETRCRFCYYLTTSPSQGAKKPWTPFLEPCPASLQMVSEDMKHTLEKSESQQRPGREQDLGRGHLPHGTRWTVVSSSVFSS